METRLRDTTKQLMRALEAFYPFVKNAEEKISLLEGDVENLSTRKRNLEAEIASKIKEADTLIIVDKKNAKEKLMNAEILLERAQALYYELYKAQVTKIVPPAAYTEAVVMPKIKEVEGKIKKEKVGV